MALSAADSDIGLVLDGESDRRLPILKSCLPSVRLGSYGLAEPTVGLRHHVSPARLRGRPRAGRGHRREPSGVESEPPPSLLTLLLEVPPFVEYSLTYRLTGDAQTSEERFVEEWLRLP